MKNITYMIVLSIMIWIPANGCGWDWWNCIVDVGEDAIEVGGKQFSNWGEALTEADIPILSDVADGADIYKGWVEDGFDQATEQLGDTFDDANDFARRLISFDTALDGVGTVVTTALRPISSTLDTVENILQTFISNPIGTLNVGNEVESLANTLETCLNQLTQLIDPQQAFDSVLDITGIDLNIFGGIPDIPDVTYKVLAFMLKPFKSAIEFACDKALPTGISELKGAIQKIIGRRRISEKTQIPSESQPCPSGDNIFCASEHISYFYDDTSNHMFRLMADGFGDLIPDPKDNSDTEVAQEIRIARFTFQLVATIVGDLCDALDQCIPDEVSVAAYCADGIACGVVKVIVHAINDILDYVIGSADLQDAEINNFRLKAIFNDRIGIIHNQKLISDRVDGLTHQVTNALNGNNDWVEGLTLGLPGNLYYGETIDIGQSGFNAIFRNGKYNIIKRECPECLDTHKIIYYRRLTDASQFDAYGYMKVWRSAHNQRGTDFGLYSTLVDAINNVNQWQYCDYDDMRVGAFRDCGPGNTDAQDCQWSSDILNNVQHSTALNDGHIGSACTKNVKFSIYVGSGNVVGKYGKNELLYVSRYFCPKGRNGDHLLTTNIAPTQFGTDLVYSQFIGNRFKILKYPEPKEGTKALYRKYNANEQDHMLTADPKEAEGHYVIDGLLGYCYKNQVEGTFALWRGYNRNIYMNHLSASDAEFTANGYTRDGILCYVLPLDYNQMGLPMNNVFDNQPTDDTIVIKISSRNLYAVCMVITGLILTFVLLTAIHIGKYWFKNHNMSNVHKYKTIKYIDSETDDLEENIGN